jgi:hypothetical protein
MLANWVYQKTTTTGTGDLTLTTVSGFSKFSDQFVIGQPFYYEILKDADGTPVEVGIGKLTNSTTLQRVTVMQTMSGGVLTNTGATAVDLAAGTYRVICSIPMQAGIGIAPPGANSLAANRGGLPYPLVPNVNSRALTANTMHVVAGRVDAGKGISALGAHVTTAAGTSSDVLRIGLYPVMPDGSAGPLVAESGDLRCDTTGVKSASVVDGKTNIPPGWYYFGMLCSAAPSLRAGNTTTFAQVGPLGMLDAGAPYVYATCAAVSAGWTSMPSSMPTISSLTQAQFPALPIVYY